MKKPFLYKRLSKYKVSKCILELKLKSEKEIIEILHKRGYIEEKLNQYRNGFVKVSLVGFYILIEHTISKEDFGVRCLYEEDVLLEYLRYFEYKMKRC